MSSGRDSFYHLYGSDDVVTTAELPITYEITVRFDSYMSIDVRPLMDRLEEQVRATTGPNGQPLHKIRMTGVRVSQFGERSNIVS